MKILVTANVVGSKKIPRIKFSNPINHLDCIGLWVFNSDEDSSYGKCGWKQNNS